MTLHSRDELEGLLLFYANGSLSDSERRAVEDRLADDAGLRGDLTLLSDLRDEMQAERPPMAGEIAFRKLMNEVDRTPQEAPPVRGWARHSRAAIRLAVAAMAFVLVAQSVLLWRDDIGGYQLASGAAAGDVIVAFNPGATEDAIRNVLLELDLQIVSGPSSLGLYRLNSGNPATAVKALATRPDIIESAQNVEN